MKECELCNAPARMYCESDQASLCWDCDSKVHSANFLVAKHSRSLLCHACQSVTPWQASGVKLGPTVSVCERCINGCNGKEERGRGAVEEEESHGGNEDEEDEDNSDDDDNDDDDDDGNDDEADENDVGEGTEDDDDDEDGENQVVPWSSTPPPPIPSSSEESSSRFFNSSGIAHTAAVSSLKRMRENVDLGSQDDICRSSSQPNFNSVLAASTARTADEEATSFGSFRQLKERKRALTTQSSLIDTKSAALISTLKRLERNTISGNDASAAILHICKLSKDPRAVDLFST